MTYTTPGGPSYILSDDIRRSNQHIAVAGATGSGKSVFINQFVFSALAAETPDRFGLILIDPKRVELSRYRRIPHTIRYAQDPDEIVAALTEAERLMMWRFSVMERSGLLTWTGGTVYVIIDELADLINNDRKRCEPILARIATLGRAARVLLLVATQSPSRQVMTARVCCNITCRIALHCESPIESRQIIGTPAAVLLPQFGTCIYKRPGVYCTDPVGMVPETDILDRVRFWEAQNVPTDADVPKTGRYDKDGFLIY